MNLRDFFKILICTIIFILLIFIIKNFFLGGKEDIEYNIIEEKYIEPTVLLKFKPTKEIILDDLSQSLNLSSAKLIKYTFIPKDFSKEEDTKEYKSVLDSFIFNNILEKKIDKLDIMLYKEKGEVRGRLQNKIIKLFGIHRMKLNEFLAVFIHEFGHFYDLYILKRTNMIDESDYFYGISWLNVEIIRSGSTQGDFVSGYAMTNKYEDFAESFLYYILHNDDFKERSKNSLLLKEKYDFFNKYIFNGGEFKDSNKWKKGELKDYYRDITKIDYSLENFLQYLKK